jgi:uncharacterized membrane protein YbhN (UPF0104 family)
VRAGSAELPEFGMSDLPLMAVVTASLLLVMVMNGLVLRDLTARFGTPMVLREWLGITIVGSMLNLVSPVRGGAAVRAIYLKRAHGLAYTRFAGVLGASFVCSIATSGALAATALLVLGIPGGGAGWIALVTSTVLTIGPIVALLGAPPFPKARAGFVHRLGQVLDGWRVVGRDRGLVVRILAWSALGALFHASAFVGAFRLAGFEGDSLVSVASSAFARIGALVALTPAGLGIFEAFGVVSAQILGGPAGPAIVGVLIVRVCATAVSVLGGIAFAPSILRDAGRSKMAADPATTRRRTGT